MHDHGLRSFGEIAAHYFAEKKPQADNERRWFRIQRKIHQAVRYAGLAQGPHGKRFRHQYRIPHSVLKRVSRALLRNLRKLGRCKSFEDLLQQVQAAIGRIRGVGPLMTYDTAVRIGARLGLAPEKVYLHAGTRHGATALGLEGKRATLSLSELPPPLNKLDAQEAEDVLCIYAVDLGRLASKRANT